MPGEQRVRAFLYYFSLAIFFIGLPMILSFALGYKFNPRTLKFAKSGLISLKTQPQGAGIYLDGKLLNEKTPATINELLPGEYSLKVELEKHYPWVSSVRVEAGKATRLEKIILFPLIPNVKQVNQDKISSFWVDKERGRIYCLGQDENIIYASDLEGENFKEAAALPEGFSPPQKFKVSPDKQKICAFNLHQIAVVYLEPQDSRLSFESSFILDYSRPKITEVFWHSDSYHLIVVTEKNIEIIEARPKGQAVGLANLNKKNTSAFYDEDRNTLYFMDSQKAADGQFYDNVYKLNLSARFFPFQELIKPKTNE